MLSINVQSDIASPLPCGRHSFRHLPGVVHMIADDGLFSSWLSALIGSSGIRVRCFRSGASYLAYKRSETPACLLMTLRLPDMCGLDFQSMLAHTDVPPIVFVSDHDDVRSCVRAMKQGAVDFLTKAEIEMHVLAAIETSFRKHEAADVNRREQTTLKKRWHTLTPREAEVFRYVVAGYLNKQAASDLEITENTFQVHRGRVMKKMGADSLAALVRMSIRLAEQGENALLQASTLGLQGISIPAFHKHGTLSQYMPASIGL